ncbi:Ig-like domain-containing protein, partial [Aliarcobacter butzleri]|uniref:Ig-like domain-containing protein n=2 Tax=Aliarcobacter butzleri TaxID=28197 RepID=UPI002B2478BF
MAQVGIVKTLEGGVFYAKDSSGNIRELSIGDSISENEVVYGDSSNQTSAKVEMELSGNDIIVLNQAQQQLIDSSLNQVTFGNEEVIFSKGDINTTFENADLSAWNNTTDDVSDDMETAAGDPTQQETQAGEEEPTEEGRVTARFSARDGSSTDVRSDLRDTIDFGTQLSEGDNDDEIAAELLNPQATTTTVNPVNDVPVAVNDTFTLDEDASYTGTVTSNDTLSGDGGNKFTVAKQPEHGTVTMNEDGTFTYTPAKDYNGADSFEYTITDVDGDTSTAVVSLTVNPVNDVPVAVNDTFTLDEDASYTGTVTSNDTLSG